MSEFYVPNAVWVVPPTIEERWEDVRDGRFPERYVEGMERDMAEALWGRLQNKYPGRTVKLRVYGEEETVEVPTPLFLVAGGGTYDADAIGSAGETIERARTCAEIAREYIKLQVET